MLLDQEWQLPGPLEDAGRRLRRERDEGKDGAAECRGGFCRTPTVNGDDVDLPGLGDGGGLSWLGDEVEEGL